MYKFKHPCGQGLRAITYVPVTIGAYSSGFIIHSTIYIRAVVERPITPLNRSSSTLVHKMPVEASKWPVLITFVLKESLTLFHSEFFKVPGSHHKR